MLLPDQLRWSSSNTGGAIRMDLEVQRYLVECIESLTEEQQRQIAGDNTTVLYGL